MANRTLNVKLLLRNDTSANWTSANPVLGKGELGIESDTRKHKFGDGTTAWNELPYLNKEVTKESLGLGNVANERQFSLSNPPTLLKGQDTRNANEPPSAYMAKGSAVVTNEFKYINVIGASALLGGTYCQVTTFNPWSDNSGGLPVQIATSSDDTGKVIIRAGVSDSAWGAWRHFAPYIISATITEV